VDGLLRFARNDDNKKTPAPGAADLKSLHCSGKINQGLQIESGTSVIDLLAPLLSEVRERSCGKGARTSESGR